MKLVDTNIFLRLLLWDDSVKAVACKKLFERTLKNKEILITTPLVIAEIVWVLEKTYKYPKSKIADAVLTILATENIQIENKNVLMESVGLYKLKNIDFIDAFNVVTMYEHDASVIYSYDSDFDKLAGIKRQEPQ